MAKVIVSKAQFEAFIFDLDGVITQSAKLHAKAWKEMFDGFLEEINPQHKPFDIKHDYLAYIDGKPRIEGIRSFLKARDIEISEEKIQELASQKNTLFLRYLRENGVEIYKTSVELVHQLRKRDFKLAIVTSSKNCSEILKTAGLEDLFDVQVDGIKSEKLKLKGKPHADIFLQAASELDVEPSRAVVVEDSLAGVEAGKNGSFGYVIGVDRGDQAAELKEKGANTTVSDLKEIEVRD